MSKLLTLPIRTQLFAIVFVMASFAAGVIVFFGVSSRNDQIKSALNDSAALAESLFQKHEEMVASARQLMVTLAQLPQIRSLSSVETKQILKEVLDANPKYSNIFIADPKGRVLASALPAKDVNVSDRRYFITSLATGHFSAGEFIISRYTGKPVLAFGYPFRDIQGKIVGVIVIGIDMSHYRSVLDALKLPSGSSYLLLDHKGTIISRGIHPTDFVGQQYDPVGFKRMVDGPDKDSFIALAHDGIKRLLSYRKVHIEGEQTPYMYIRAGIPFDSVLSVANKALARNMALLISGLCLVVIAVWLIGKHSIINRITVLEQASKRLAGGDLTMNVSALNSGGELGRLALTFDHMASQIAQREAALRASEKMLQTIIDTEPECVKLLDEKANLIMMNRAGLDMIQVDSLEQVKGQCVCPLITSEYWQPFLDLTRRIFQGESGTLLFEVIGMKGRHLWLETHAVPLRNEKNEIFALLGVTRDVTERKHAEEALRQSEHFIRNILDTVDEGFIVIDKDYRILTANKAYCSQAGRSSEEIIGSHCYELSHKINRPCHEEGVECATRHIFETGTPHTALHRHKDSNGNILFVETKAFPIKDDSGAVTSVIEVINNVTEKYLLEEERLKTQKLESIGTLAGGIAHDFNNLLQGVFGYISLAKLTHDRKEKSLAMLDQAEEALNLSVNLTTQLLTFSKGGNPVKKLIRLQPTIENAVKFALSGSSADYRMDITPNLWSVEADAGQLAQVIQNIVLNANEAMAGKGTVTISIKNMDIPTKADPRLPAGGQFLRIDIQDTGTGISEQNIPKIFDPYFTTKQRGSGLGLATSYSIIKNHGGLIEVTSEQNRGTTFTIYLPASGQTDITAEPARLTAATTKTLKVLLMDDEDVVRSVAKEMIAALGHEVEAAEDGNRAIELFRQARDKGRPFDLIILDLTVKGGMGGEEAIAKILEIDPKIRAVVSSGYADSTIVANYRNYGFSAILNKPYKLASLKDCLSLFVS